MNETENKPLLVNGRNENQIGGKIGYFVRYTTANHDGKQGDDSGNGNDNSNNTTRGSNGQVVKVNIWDMIPKMENFEDASRKNVILMRSKSGITQSSMRYAPNGNDFQNIDNKNGMVISSDNVRYLNILLSKMIAAYHTQMM